MSSSGWKKIKLGEAITLKRGYDLPQQNRVTGNIPVYSSAGLSGFHNEAKVQGPGVVTGRYGTLGEVFFSQEDFWPHNTTLYVQKFNGNHPKFIYYFLKTLGFANNNDKTSVPGLNRNDLHEMNVSIPSLYVQQRIASILSSLDDKIELNRQTSQTLEAIAQAIFKEWFVDFNFPGATGEMEESELGMIPKGWRVASFEDELNTERGLSYKGSNLEQSGAIPMHNLNSVYEGGGYKFEGIKYYSGDYKEKHLVEPGDLIIANTEQGHKHLLIGCPAIVPNYYGDKSIFSHHIYKLKPKSHSGLSSDYLFHLVLQPEIREQVIGFANGTTVNMLKIEGLQKPKFALPPKDLIERFTKVALSFRTMREERIKENETLASLRDSLLPKLMKGQLKINDLD